MSDLSAMPAPVPGWMRFAPYLGTPPALSARNWHVFGLLIVVSIFNQYDIALLQLTLPDIQAGFGMQDADLGQSVALIRLGSIPAFLLLAAADWLGRRHILLITITGYTLATAATAFVTSIEAFIAVQFLARLFITAEIALAVIFITEEFPAQARGWGVGAFLALASYGFALAALVFALVDVLPSGWRALYLLGVVPLILLARLRQTLPESSRFSRLTASGPATPSDTQAYHLSARWSATWQLVRQYPGRLALFGTMVLLINLGGDPATFFDPTYLQTKHSWQPWHISLLTIGAGMVALFGSAYAGKLGDRWGRKHAAALFTAGGFLAVLFFYNIWGVWLPLGWAAMLFAFRGIQVTFSTFGAELFPTAMRGSATGLQTTVGTLGGIAGLMLHSLLAAALAAPWQAIWLLALVMLVALTGLPFLPETSGRRLDSLEPAGSGPENS